MDEAHEVKITDDPEEAARFRAAQIPYIVWLNEHNREKCFPAGSFCVEDPGDIDPVYLERVYRRAKGIPWDITETPRLKIREIKVEDVPRLYELYSDESITRYMEPLFKEPEQEKAYTREYIKNVYGFYGYGMWIIEEKASGQVIGRAGLENKEGYAGLEMGIMLGVDHQHKGYGYEACSAILRYGIAELGQDTYYVLIDEGNAASIELCTRLGFVKKDIVRCSEVSPDGLLKEKEYAHYIYSARTVL